MGGEKDCERSIGYREKDWERKTGREALGIEKEWVERKTEWRERISPYTEIRTYMYRDKRSGWRVLLTYVGIQREWDRRDDLKTGLDRLLSVIFELSRCDLHYRLDFSAVERGEVVH